MKKTKLQNRLDLSVYRTRQGVFVYVLINTVTYQV